MTPDELKRIANSGTYGSGKSVRDKLSAEASVLEDLPEANRVPTVVAATDHSHMVAMAHFGNFSEDGLDWGLYHDGREDSVWCFGDDAKDDAKAVAAIINAYRMGILVRASK